LKNRNLNELLLHRLKAEAGSIYIALWKGSKDPKIELLVKEPDPDKWDFVEVRVVDKKG